MRQGGRYITDPATGEARRAEWTALPGDEISKPADPPVDAAVAADADAASGVADDETQSLAPIDGVTLFHADSADAPSESNPED